MLSAGPIRRGVVLVVYTEVEDDTVCSAEYAVTLANTFEDDAVVEADPHPDGHAHHPRKLFPPIRFTAHVGTERGVDQTEPFDACGLAP
jgi:hypothetical protein